MKCLPSPPPPGPPEGGPPCLLSLLSPPPPPPGPPPPLSLLKSAYSSTFLTKNLDAPRRLLADDPFKTMLVDSCNVDDVDKRGSRRSVSCDTQDMHIIVLSIRVHMMCTADLIMYMPTPKETSATHIHHRPYFPDINCNYKDIIDSPESRHWAQQRAMPMQKTLRDIIS